MSETGPGPRCPRRTRLRPATSKNLSHVAGDKTLQRELGQESAQDMVALCPAATVSPFRCVCGGDGTTVLCVFSAAATRGGSGYGSGTGAQVAHDGAPWRARAG